LKREEERLQEKLEGLENNGDAIARIIADGAMPTPYTTATNGNWPAKGLPPVFIDQETR